MLLQNDPSDVDHVRSMASEDAHATDMLRWMEERGLDLPSQMSVLREAFGLDFHTVSCIGGWFADGTGELSDEQINTRLDPVVRADVG